MKSLTELFYNVNRNVPYITVGDGVDYCFIQEDRTLYIYFEPSDGKVDWKHNFKTGDTFEWPMNSNVHWIILKQELIAVFCFWTFAI